MNYHITKNKYLVDIFKNGLKPIVGENSEKVNDLREEEMPKLCFSQGYEGEILMAVNFFMRYHYDKSCGIENFEEFMKQYDVMLAFDDNLVQNENGDDIADAHTTNQDGILTQELKVVRLQDKDGEFTYDRAEIVNYMMSQITLKEVTQNEELLNSKPLMYLEEEGISDKNYEYFLKEFYERNEANIQKYKNGEYRIDYQDFREYCKQKGIGSWSLTEEEKSGIDLTQHGEEPRYIEKDEDYTK